MTRRGSSGFVLLSLLLSCGAASAAPDTAPLPGPETRDVPPPASAGTRAPIPPARAVEIGADLGLVARPSTSASVSYGTGFAYGGSMRTDILPWLGARVSARIEDATASLAGHSLGIAGAHFDDASLTRVYLSAAAEPTFSPVDRLGLFAGIGIGWGRTTCPTLQSSDQSNVSIPLRSGVFVDFPLSLGVRYEVLRDWVVIQASGSVSFLTSQSGRLFEPVSVTGQNGLVVRAAGFPELGTSFTALLGVGVLL